MTTKDKQGEVAEAVAQVATAIEQAPRPDVKPVADMKMATRDQKQNEWFVYADKGVTIADVLKRDYWKHVSWKLRDTDKLVVVCDDRSWYAEFIVFATYPQGAEVHLLHKIVVDHVTLADRADSRYEITQGGFSEQWIVREISTGRTIKSQLSSRELAGSWLADHMKAHGIRRAA